MSEVSDRERLDEQNTERHLQKLASQCHGMINSMLASRYAHKMLMAAHQGLTVISTYKATRRKSHVR